MTFAWLFHYDAFLRFQKTRTFTDFPDDWLPGAGQMVYFAIVKFFAWTGMTLLLLFFASVVRTLAKIGQQPLQFLDWSALLLVLLFVGIGVFGRMKAEVARYWIYLVQPTFPARCTNWISNAARALSRIYFRKSGFIPF